MAVNPYAIDFSGLGTEVQGLKKRRYAKKIKGEVDALVKKREGLDTSLEGQVSKQRQLMEDTPELDQTQNTVGLNQLQQERVEARTNKYSELGGLSAKELQGMSTDAVDIYKARVATERIAARDRDDQMTADALITYEAMGKDPKYLKDWFNETQAYKWGLADGVERFEVSGDSVLVYEKGKDYSEEGNVPASIPKQQFDMFAASALNPESTKIMAKSLQEGNIPIIVKANQLKESMKYYDSLEEARVAMGISDADFKKMMGVPTAVETLKEYINVVKDGKVVGLQTGVDVEGKAFRREGPPKQATGKGSGDLLKQHMNFAKLLMQAKESRLKSQDTMLTSEFGAEFFEWDDKMETFVPQLPKIRKHLKGIVTDANKLLETDPSNTELVEAKTNAERTLNALKETKEQALRTDDAVKNVLDILNQSLGDVGGFAEEKLAAPVALEQTVGFTAPPGSAQAGKTMPTAVAHENVIAKSKEDKKKKIEEIQKRLKNKLAGNK